MAGIKMEGNTEMDKVLLGRTSEFQVFIIISSGSITTHHLKLWIGKSIRVETKR